MHLEGTLRDTTVLTRGDPERDAVFVFVLYDTGTLRRAAADICDRLQGRFATDLNLHVMWSHFSHLADPHYSREAAEVAAQADLVIITSDSDLGLPGMVARWLGAWICQRQRPEAILAGLIRTRVTPSPTSGGRHEGVAQMLAVTAALTGRTWLKGTLP